MQNTGARPAPRPKVKIVKPESKGSGGKTSTVVVTGGHPGSDDSVNEAGAVAILVALVIMVVVTLYFVGKR